MIVVDKGKLKFLKAGRTVRVDVEREHRKGRAYTVRLEGSKTTKLRVEVLEIDRQDRGYSLKVRQVRYEERPHYLAANPGAIRADYTNDPSRAARESDGSPIEAVDVDGKWLAKVARAASDRDDVIRRQMAHRARVERRQGRNLSGSRVKWSAAPPASDIQADVSAGKSSATPEREAA